MMGKTPAAGEMRANADSATVNSFGDEWTRFDQSALSAEERGRIFNAYFSVFPWSSLPPNAEGFDMGCGSGRWAKLVAPRVGRLNCIDASDEALSVARAALAGRENVSFIHANANAVPLAPASQDFGYSLGVLHHIPDTQAALNACVALLKPGAPMLVYLYYRFDNRPAWFRMLWRTSEVLRAGICRLPGPAKSAVTDLIALCVYLPLARIAKLAESLGLDARNFPLRAYKDFSFYTMRTDSRDRFGTPLEQRFTRAEIIHMFERAGCERVAFSNAEPYWCAVGCRTAK
jgi:ubiquinone/menaquinone biosynthesis C-methylase UbiE